MKRVRWDIPYTFIAVSGVVLIAAIALWQGYRTFTNAFGDDQQAYATRKILFTTENLLLDQETGVRGFTSTGEQIFLQPYLRSRSELPQQLRTLRSLVVEQADMRLSVPYGDLAATYDNWSTDVVEPLLKQPDRSDSTQIQRRGKDLMDRMREDVDVMLGAVDAEATQGNADLQSAVLRSVLWASIVATVLLVLAFQLERRRQIVESEARRFFDTASDMLCVASFDGRFLRVNPSWHDVLGYADEDLTGRPFVDLVHPNDVQNTIDAMSTLATGKSVVGFHNRYRAKDGTYRSLVWNSTPVLSQKIMYASARDETDRIRLEIELAQYAITDVLTGLPNRRWFLQQVDEAVAVAKRYHLYCAVLFVDLDGFKAVNDSLGHAAGDKALQEMSVVIRGALRESDLMARLGGDEFAVLLPSVPAPHLCEAAAKRIVQSVTDHVSTTALVRAISVSVGIAEYPRDCANGDELLAHADAAMYEAKKRGGATFARYQAT
jgi:diguanylate cyclase (GGDEF)-like protein/PAS domain S-box-containing protein